MDSNLDSCICLTSEHCGIPVIREMHGISKCLLIGWASQVLHLQNGDILGPQQCTDQIKDFSRKWNTRHIVSIVDGSDEFSLGTLEREALFCRNACTLGTPLVV